MSFHDFNDFHNFRDFHDFHNSNDFNDYIRAQEAVDENYRNQALWTKKSILSVAGSGKFSSDRTIREYAEDIWDVKPTKRPMPTNPKPYGPSHKM